MHDEKRLLNRLLADLCERALVEAGQLKLKRQPIDLAALIGSTITTFTPVADERNVVLAAQRDLGAQVLRNLVANALWHTPMQRHIAVEVWQIDRVGRINER